MTRNIIGSTAVLVGLLLAAAGAQAEVPPTQLFRAVTIAPAHPSAQPGSLANQFCTKKGFTKVGAHLFVGFHESNGAMAALFRQITCVKYEVRRWMPHADDITIGF